MRRFVQLAATAACVALAAPVLAQDDAAVTDSEAEAMVDEIDAADDGNGPYRQAYEKALAALKASGDARAAEYAEYFTLYILGNTANTLFHEWGHALRSELDLPVVGKEEDAVDALANIIMVAKTTDPVLDEMLRAVADDYFANGRFAEDSGEETSAWDEHSPDKARAYAVICILVGADPDSYKEAADNAGMPQERQESCAHEYETTLAAWGKLLEPHTLNEGETNKTRRTVTYGKPAAGNETVAEMIKASGIVEAVADEIAGFVRLPNDIAIGVEACDDVNAYWSPDERKITLCYEIVQSYLDNASAPGAEE